MRIFNSTPRDDNFRMPGEFERHQGCIMIWPVRPGSWIYGGKAAKKVFAKIAAIIAQSEHVYMLADHEHLKEAHEHLKEAHEHLKEAQEQKNPKDTEADFSETRQYKEVHHMLERQVTCEGKGIEVVELESDDAWARDVAPTFVKNADGIVRGINWSFNAWGGDYDGLYADWTKDNLVAKRFLEYAGFDCYDAEPFVLEGGSIHSDGDGTMLVTESCLCSPGRNPKLSKAQIEEKLKQYCNVEKVVWLPCGIYQDETNEHVDNVCAFVRPGEVVLAWTDDPADPQYACSQACLRYLEGATDAQGRRIRVHKLPIPRVPVLVTQEDLEGYTFEDGEDVREVGERLAASYVNYYCANGAIVLPAFGGENAASDAQAAAILAGLFPERRIISVYAREILTGGGNIHCITQQIPEGAKL